MATDNKYNNITDHWNIVSVISRCASRALSEYNECHEVTLISVCSKTVKTEDIVHCSVTGHSMMLFQFRFVLCMAV